MEAPHMKIKSTLVLGLLVVIAFGIWQSVQADGPISGRNGRAEVRFLQGMIDHHQMALDMSENCLAKAAAPELKTLCQNIIAAQSAEIAQMQRWLSDWYGISYVPMPLAHMLSLEGMAGHGGIYKRNLSAHGAHGGHGGAAALPDDPPMMMGMMAGLSQLSGTAYDIAWLEAMIDHHGDALHMAERVLKWAEHAELRTLAQAILRDQSAEIAMMEAMIQMLSQ
ncbi:MAG: hypothetical protein CUN49_12270 [Candidatus Thermofonsia Clade 1 bacterium]|uniref:DUF305 domain-containing protein n=1 Tax=Candidatus Thermofonsia Clade 1 bacterium TaxID=2364210 RepID=A0A2M8PC31_9CHLR|nr:MAG: hypothetical protein CUN49_12270 [Candidatus Thermofonsia Clade 1 bacterium]RMF50831.1 MAG: DUF305 domain-containing protein [Chloroflexota bacterium]